MYIDYNPADEYDKHCAWLQSQADYDYEHAYCDWCRNATDDDDRCDDDTLWCKLHGMLVEPKAHPIDYDCISFR